MFRRGVGISRFAADVGLPVFRDGGMYEGRVTTAIGLPELPEEGRVTTAIGVPELCRGGKIDGRFAADVGVLVLRRFCTRAKLSPSSVVVRVRINVGRPA